MRLFGKIFNAGGVVPFKTFLDAEFGPDLDASLYTPSSRLTKRQMRNVTETANNVRDVLDPTMRPADATKALKAILKVIIEERWSPLRCATPQMTAGVNTTTTSPGAGSEKAEAEALKPKISDPPDVALLLATQRNEGPWEQYCAFTFDFAPSKTKAQLKDLLPRLEARSKAILSFAEAQNNELDHDRAALFGAIIGSKSIRVWKYDAQRGSLTCSTPVSFKKGLRGTQETVARKLIAVLSRIIVHDRVLMKRVEKPKESEAGSLPPSGGDWKRKLRAAVGSFQYAMVSLRVGITGVVTNGLCIGKKSTDQIT